MTDFQIAFEPRRRAERRRHQEAAAAPARRYPARIARSLALAHALQRRVDAGEFSDYAAAARALGFTRARLTQIMDLLLLAPEIQHEILVLEFPPGRQPIGERATRQVLRAVEWTEQRRRWSALKAKLNVTP